MRILMTAVLLFCVSMTSTQARSVKGTVLGLTELADPEFRKLAQDFAPCMVFAGPDSWPVHPAYQWSQGSPLMRTVERGEDNYVDIEEVLSASVLSQKPWADLPEKNAKGEPYIYFVDGPGENSGPKEEEATWISEWRRIQGGGPPEKAPYPPTVFVQGLWLPKSEEQPELLVIKYWFFYAYNKWLNSHESDWEQMHVALKRTAGGKGKFGGTWEIDHFQYDFHSDAIILSPKEVYLVKPLARKTGVHPVVFVGGKARSAIIKWTGLYSGGSYPWPAKFNFGIVDDDTSQPKRFLHADQLKLEFITDPAKMDYAKRPELSWLNRDVRLGQPRVKANDPLVFKKSGDTFIAHAAQKGNWDDHGVDELWPFRTRTNIVPVAWPEGWQVVNIPTADAVKYGLKAKAGQ